MSATITMRRTTGLSWGSSPADSWSTARARVASSSGTRTTKRPTESPPATPTMASSRAPRGRGLSDERGDRGEEADAERRSDRDPRRYSQDVHERGDDEGDAADPHDAAEETEHERDGDREPWIGADVFRGLITRRDREQQHDAACECEDGED